MNVPQSLLVAALVVAWLVVLVPSSSRRKEHVKQTVEGRGFRVLRRTETNTRTLLRRRTAVGVGAGYSDGEGEMADRLEDRDDEDVVTDEFASSDIEFETSTPTYRTDADETSYSADDVARDTTEEATYRATDRESDADPTVVFEQRWVRESESEQTIRLDPVSRLDRDETTQIAAGHTDADDEASLRAEYQVWRQSTRTDSDDQADLTDHSDDPVGAADERPIPRRSGRGTYDPEAAERARAYKFARRRRTLLVLCLLTVGLSIASYAVSPTLWIGAGLAAVLLVLFLFYLRRQVRIEADIRDRRQTKLERARQIRPERRYHEEMSDPYRAALTSQLPTTQRHHGGRVVVDLEDDDPGFDDLEYYEPVQYRRAVG